MTICIPYIQYRNNITSSSINPITSSICNCTCNAPVTNLQRRYRNIQFLGRVCVCSHGNGKCARARVRAHAASSCLRAWAVETAFGRLEIRLHHKCNNLDVLYNIATVTSHDVYICASSYCQRSYHATSSLYSLAMVWSHGKVNLQGLAWVWKRSSCYATVGSCLLDTLHCGRQLHALLFRASARSIRRRALIHTSLASASTSPFFWRSKAPLL